MWPVFRSYEFCIFLTGAWWTRIWQLGISTSHFLQLGFDIVDFKFQISVSISQVSISTYKLHDKAEPMLSFNSWAPDLLISHCVHYTTSYSFGDNYNSG